MKKITIMALHLGYGGVEKAIADLANNLANDYSVNIISTYKLYPEPIYPLNKKIKIEYLMEDRVPNRESFFNAIKKFKFITAIKEGIYGIKTLKLRTKLMRDYIKDCNSDVIISTRSFHNEILGKYGKSSAVKIGWEHNHHDGKKNYFNKVCKSVYNLDFFVLVSKGLTQDYKRELKNKKCKCVYIPNMLTYDEAVISSLNDNNLVSVGRMSQEKGFFDLIDVFSLVVKEVPDAKLNLIGSGKLYSQISKYVSKKHLQNNIILHGYQDNNYVHNVLSTSSLYVMTSFTESFGIVLLESFAHGVPCLAFDSAKGAKEVINNGKDGYVIKGRNKEKMANVIINILENKQLRKSLGKEAIKSTKKYKAENVMPEWINLIEKNK